MKRRGRDDQIKCCLGQRLRLERAEAYLNVRIARQIAVGYRGKLRAQLDAAHVITTLRERERRLTSATANFEDVSAIGYTRQRTNVVIHLHRIAGTDGVIERRYLIECCAQLIPEIINTLSSLLSSLVTNRTLLPVTFL